LHFLAFFCIFLHFLAVALTSTLLPPPRPRNLTLVEDEESPPGEKTNAPDEGSDGCAMGNERWAADARPSQPTSRFRACRCLTAGLIFKNFTTVSFFVLDFPKRTEPKTLFRVSLARG
jgi:hypothetical protein